MVVEIVIRGTRYRLTNEGLKIGDTVFPIGTGRQAAEDLWILHKINWSRFDLWAPHRIVGRSSRYWETDKGYGHHSCYFKLCKVENHVRVDAATDRFARWEWIDVPVADVLANALNNLTEEENSELIKPQGE